MAPQPTKEDKFSFGLWTVGWAGPGDFFGQKTRVATQSHRSGSPASPKQTSQKCERSTNEMPSELHVATTGSDHADGSEDRPFRTINRAAALAQPGDTVVVHGGEYREWVQPRRGGLSDQRRITYTAAPGEHVVIKGSEPVTGWDRVSGDVWTVAVPNDSVRLVQPVRRGDRRRLDRLRRRSPPRRSTWARSTSTGPASTRSSTVDEVSDPPLRTEMIDDWTGTVDRIRNPEQTQLVWYAEVGADQTTIWANFQGADPNDRTRRDQRPPLGLLPDRASPRLHHRPRVRARPGRDPVGAADRRPARTDRPELGQGLDHRGQRHPRREVLGGLHRQGDLHRPQLRHRAPRQARLPVPARVGVRRPPDRLGPGAHRLPHRSAATPSTTAARTASSVTSAVCSPPSRTTTSTTSRSSGSSTATRSAASSCTPPST